MVSSKLKFLIQRKICKFQEIHEIIIDITVLYRILPIRRINFVRVNRSCLWASVLSLLIHYSHCSYKHCSWFKVWLSICYRSTISVSYAMYTYACCIRCTHSNTNGVIWAGNYTSDSHTLKHIGHIFLVLEPFWQSWHNCRRQCLLGKIKIEFHSASLFRVSI